ncbi:hypothetical protein N752_31260 [Desulforamulus aquiferis]|nr:cache domain-containing protein [Desulforamulus aquiferis]RYD01232.1 hypothetical protein N752_31260 [Desulforamulus aquiferis]
MLRKISMSKRIYAIVILMVMALSIMLVTLTWGIGRVSDISVQDAQLVMLDNQKETLKISVDSMAEALGNVIKEEPSIFKQQELLRKAISTIRFEDDESGYYFIYDFSGFNIAHPTKPQYQGTHRLNSRDQDGKAYIMELRNIAIDGGFVEYTFDEPGKGNVQKLAYAKIVPGTNYWVATAFNIDSIEAKKTEIRNKIEDVSKSLSITLGCIFLLLLLFIVLPLTQAIVNSIVRPLKSITGAVKSISEENYVKVEVSGKDELAILGSTFNDMTSKLATAKESLTAYQEQLEAMVYRRTEELTESFGN